MLMEVDVEMTSEELSEAAQSESMNCTCKCKACSWLDSVGASPTESIDVAFTEV